MAIIESIAGYVAPKIGAVVLRELIEEHFDQKDGAKWKGILLGEKPDITPILNGIQKQLDLIAGMVKDVQLINVFKGYNDACSRLEVIFEQVLAANAKNNNVNRQNTYKNIVARDGVLQQTLLMKNALFAEKQPSGKSFLQQYSDILINDKKDVFQYCQRMDAVVDHFKLYAIIAMSLREDAIANIEDKSKIKDVEINRESMINAWNQYVLLTQPHRQLADTIRGLSREGAYVLLHHNLYNEKYLTAFEGGKRLSESEPFGDYRYYSLFTNSDKHGMPQVFLNTLGKGQKRNYSEMTINCLPFVALPGAPLPGTTLPNTVTMQLNTDTQLWQIKLVEEDNIATWLTLRHKKSDMFLSGVDGGRAYLSRDQGRHNYWRVILDKTDKPGRELLPFLLANAVADHSLDSNGERVYAEGRAPSYENPCMKWRLEQTLILHKGSVLNHGELISSPNGEYTLSYANGRLSLCKGGSEKWSPSLWNSITGSGFCIMQEDGNFVIYGDDRKACWATGTENYAGSVLSLDNDGVLRITTSSGEVIYQKP